MLGAGAAMAVATSAQALTPALQELLSGSPYCAEAMTLFAAMNVKPPTALKRLYNTAILALKGAGIWSLRDAYYFMCVHDAQAARLNVKKPGTFNLTAVSSPAFTQYVGYAGNGTTAYLNTNFNPSTAPAPQLVQNSASAGVWSLEQADDPGDAIGYATGSGDTALLIDPNWSDGRAYGQINSSAGANVANGDGRGWYLINRSGSAALQLYKSGSSIATGTTSSIAPANLNVTLLKGEGTVFWSGSLAMAAIGGSLTSTQQAAEYAILNAFKTGANAL